MEKLVQEARRDGKKIELQEIPDEAPRQALIGIHSCDLQLNNGLSQLAIAPLVCVWV